jgi:hypothetical protein
MFTTISIGGHMGKQTSMTAQHTKHMTGKQARIRNTGTCKQQEDNNAQRPNLAIPQHAAGRSGSDSCS